MSADKPVTPEVLAALGPEKAARLTVWSTNHSLLFDLRIHSVVSCPIIFRIKHWFWEKGWWPKWLLGKWEDTVYDLYKAKHEEEDHCNCPS